MFGVLWALAGAVAWAGCSVPAPEPTGQIRCGENDAGGTLCPEGWECRWGRCCDATNGVDHCPQELPRDNSGQQYAPDAQGRCPLDYENRFGFCCPADTGAECPAGIVGAHCAIDADCIAPSGLTPVCLTNQEQYVLFPGGYCTALGCDLANPDTSCGPGATCRAGANGGSFCTRACQVPSGAYYSESTCPGSGGQYTCYRASNDFSNPSGNCLPDCTHVSGVCGTPLQCFDDYHFCGYPCTLDIQCTANVAPDSTCDRVHGHCQ